MKRVLLIGDSTRIRYEPLVAQMLGGAARVSGPTDNCWSSRRIREHFNDWIEAARPDVVHLNAGLHDIAFKTEQQKPSDTRLVEPDEYRENLLWLVERTRTRTGARVILATTTPINEAAHNAAKPVIRREADVLAYNAILCDVAQQTNTELNDLYAVMAEALAREAAKGEAGESLLTSDGVHFTDAGSRLLAEAVAAAVQREL